MSETSLKMPLTGEDEYLECIGEFHKIGIESSSMILRILDHLHDAMEERRSKLSLCATDAAEANRQSACIEDQIYRYETIIKLTRECQSEYYKLIKLRLDFHTKAEHTSSSNNDDDAKPGSSKEEEVSKISDKNLTQK